MNGLDLAALARATANTKMRMATLEQALNEADSRLGDGDTGVMLARVVEAMAAIDYAGQPDIGAALAQMARSTASVTGSSLGTLIATGLLAVSKRAKGEAAIAWADLGGHLTVAVEAMAARGGAELGDKTVLDILDAIAGALTGKSEPAALTEAAIAAARGTLVAFRDRPCRIGRARMFAEKSVGMDDPGMLAVHEIVLAVTGEAAA
jgi:dihydroxyacetone kinase